MKQDGSAGLCCQLMEASLLPDQPSAVDWRFEDIAVDSEIEFRHVVNARDVEAFASLSGDWNPLHVNSQFAAASEYGKPIVHGMLLASFFSRLVGMHLPGTKCLYLSQSLDFCAPAFVNDEVIVSGRVLHKNEPTRTLTIQTTIVLTTGKLLVRGKAIVRVRP
jgi:acyl dehydratase